MKYNYKNRYYIEKDGIKMPVPGVTTILGILNKPALVPWANKLGLEGIDVKDYQKIEADVGKIAHKIIEGDIKGQTPDLYGFRQEDIDRAMATSIPKWYAWKESNNIEFLLSEEPLSSSAYCYGGTFDILAEVNGIQTLIDIKTSKDIYPEMEYQLAAYRQLLIEKGYEVKEGMVIRLGKDDDTDFGIHTITETRMDLCFEIFNSCLSVYNNQKRLKIIGGQNAVRI